MSRQSDRQKQGWEECLKWEEEYKKADKWKRLEMFLEQAYDLQILMSQYKALQRNSDFARRGHK